MTAEIAILNRSALALAADSAVTISVGGKTKVYDTAEKLFELSRTQPIALMIYNNVEFVGVPLDVLIRKFRTERCSIKTYETIKETADDFVEYIGAFRHDVSEEKRYLYYVINEIFKRLNDDLNNEIRGLLREYAKSEGKAELPDGEPLLVRLINEEAERHKASALKGYLPKVTLPRFKERFSDVVEQAARGTFGNFYNEDVLKASLELSFRIMKSSVESDLLTGLVFGGFAEADMFPTLRYIEIDGVFFDALKILSVEEIDIDRMKKRADVVPFAQKEMVERFMFGMDSQLECDIERFVKTSFSDLMETWDGASDDVKASYQDRINERFSQMLRELKERSRQDLLDIVYFMSKKELADIAYALVEITSHKRRFSTDEQTVGGPIDVAILTKSEGLVWIRRKHYFNHDVNQTYVARLLNQTEGERNDGQKADGAKAPTRQ